MGVVLGTDSVRALMCMCLFCNCFVLCHFTLHHLCTLLAQCCCFLVDLLEDQMLHLKEFILQ